MCSNKNGFTLVELMVVIAIISVLIALLFPKMIQQADRAKEKRARAEITLMKSVIEQYFVENGKYPIDNNEEGNVDSIKKVMLNNGIEWGSIEDPWGQSYMYDTDDAYSSYVVFSHGPSSTDDENCILADNKNSTVLLNQKNPDPDYDGEAVSSYLPE